MNHNHPRGEKPRHTTGQSRDSGRGEGRKERYRSPYPTTEKQNGAERGSSHPSRGYDSSPRTQSPRSAPSIASWSESGKAQPPSPLKQGSLRLIPLGGQGELGRSCWVFEYNDEITIIDAGHGFVPHGMKGGIDLILPNLSDLEEKTDMIKGLVISSPHQEYAGFFLDIVNKLGIKNVYLPRIMSVRYRSELPDDVQITEMCSGTPYKIGQSFSITPITVSFSAMDSFALLIEAGNTKVMYSGALKVDHTPPIRLGRTDIRTLTNKVNEKGLDILISCSHNVESQGYTPSEASVAGRLSEIMSTSRGRVITLIGCEHLHKLKLLLEAARANNRRVCLLGDELKAWFAAAEKCDYLSFDKELFIGEDELSKAEPEDYKKIAIVIGSPEGEVLEPFFALTKNLYAHTELVRGDSLVISANPPLGTARLIANATDRLCARGVQVIGGRNAGVHVSGYAAQEELKLLHNLCRPKYFLPSHGEIRQLILHAELMGKCGVDPRNIIIIDNGHALDFDPKEAKAQISGRISVGPVFFNRNLASSMTPESIDERRNMAQEGMILTVLCMNPARTKIVAGPHIQTSGSSFGNASAWEELAKTIKSDMLQIVNKALSNNQNDKNLIRRLLHDTLHKRIKEKYGMTNPVYSIIVQEVQSST